MPCAASALRRSFALKRASSSSSSIRCLSCAYACENAHAVHARKEEPGEWFTADGWIVV